MSKKSEIIGVTRRPLTISGVGNFSAGAKLPINQHTSSALARLVKMDASAIELCEGTADPLQIDRDHAAKLEQMALQQWLRRNALKQDPSGAVVPINPLNRIRTDDQLARRTAELMQSKPSSYFAEKSPRECAALELLAEENAKRAKLLSDALAARDQLIGTYITQKEARKSSLEAQLLAIDHELESVADATPRTLPELRAAVTRAEAELAAADKAKAPNATEARATLKQAHAELAEAEAAQDLSEAREFLAINWRRIEDFEKLEAAGLARQSQALRNLIADIQAANAAGLASELRRLASKIAAVVDLPSEPSGSGFSSVFVTQNG